jgi:hypothetical protein
MRLIVVVEGQTEEDFVDKVLKPHLLDRNIHVSATIAGKLVAQDRGHRSRGGGHFKHWRADIARILAADRTNDLRVTTLFDLYGLPTDFPGLADYGTDTDTVRRCDSLEAALAAEFEDRRFIPYIQRHEFEALVLASLPSLAELLDAEDDLAGLKVLEAEVSTSAPEEVNDGVSTAPSKRLLANVPGYSKTVHGPLVTGDTGLARLCELCPRFGAWVRALESL